MRVQSDNPQSARRDAADTTPAVDGGPAPTEEVDREQVDIDRPAGARSAPCRGRLKQGLGRRPRSSTAGLRPGDPARRSPIVKRTRTLAGGLVGLLMLGASVIPASAASPHDPTALGGESLCESHRRCASIRSRRSAGVRRARRAVGALQVGRARVGQRHHLPGHAPEGPQAEAEERRLRRHLELPAAADLLVRPDAVRHRVGTRVHQDVHARFGLERLEGLDPPKPDYIGKHPGNAYMELQFYGPGYVPQFEGFGCSATQYCAAMTIDSLTLTRTTASATTPTATTTSSAASSRSTGPTSPRAASPRRPPTRCSPGRSTTPTSAR